MNFEKITHWIYEIFQLKQIKHAGWYRANVQFPDSLAEHVLLSAQIGFVIAHAEGADTAKVLQMLVFHDNAEVRIGDFDKIIAGYIPDKKKIEQQACHDQMKQLPDSLAKTLISGFEELEARETQEALIAKDADYLEQAFQARIYLENGNPGVQNWIDNIERALQTQTAKGLFEAMKRKSPNEWYVGLKKLDH